jgi:hypothetical protein
MTAAEPVATLVAARAVAARRAGQRPETPAQLAKRIIPGYRITPALALMSDALADAITGTDRRVIISVCPREAARTLRPRNAKSAWTRKYGETPPG